MISPGNLLAFPIKCTTLSVRDFLEKVYENSLRIELERAGIAVKQQEPINVRYEGQVVGEYWADLWVDDRLIIEVKAVQALIKAHEVQLVN